MSALKTRAEGIISLAPASDYNDKKGYLVTHDGTTATLSASATVRAQGVILEPGKDANSKITIALLGCYSGTLQMNAGGTIAAGAWVQQDTDGQVVTDAGSGARMLVGQALESAVAGDIFEVAPCTPCVLA